MTEICINLNGSNRNEPIKNNTLIQQGAFKTLVRTIQADLKQWSHLRDEISPTGSGLTYFIDGTRGAGKSTFLHYAYQHLPSSLSTVDTGECRVAKLMFLDPSRIENSEVLLLHVLKQLRRLVEESDSRHSSFEKNTAKFRELFKKMAGGLHLFVSDTNSLKDLDAELFLDYGLDRAADSQHLRETLHETINHVCDMCGVQALLIAVDDADTKATNCQDVLECVRKYLDTPKLIVLVTGDMEMYSLLVQNHFQQDFARDDKGLNADRKRQQNRMVEHLEEQYLLKLFPIERRMQLKTLHTLISNNKSNGGPRYFIATEPTSQALDLEDAVNKIATNGLRLRVERDKELFRDHLLKLPVRSVLQVLSTYFKHTSVENGGYTQAASEALRAMALSSLYRYDIDVESIAEGDLQSVIEAAFDLSMLDGDPDTAIYLRPQARELSLRNAYVSLSSDVARLCDQNPANALTYMLTGPGSASLFHLVQRSQNTSNARNYKELDTQELQKRFKQYFSVGRKEDTLNWAWHATATLISATTSKNFNLRQGIVGLRSGGKGAAKTIDKAIEEALAAQLSRAYPAIAFSQSSVKQYGGSHRYASIFNTLGLISKLLSLSFENDDELKQEVTRKLRQVLGQLTVSLPNWNNASVSEDSDEENDLATDDLSGHEQLPFDALVAAVLKWLKLCARLKKNYHPSAVLLGKIWTRIYFSLDNTSAHLRIQKKANRCAEAMQLFASSVINACIVEEFDYHASDNSTEIKKSNHSIDRRNPRSSWADVAKKFEAAEITADVLPLTFMIASCPLILGLMHEKNPTTSKMVATLATKLGGEFSEPELRELTCPDPYWTAIGKATVATPSTGGNSKKEDDVIE
jgi:hypothetical protein